MVFPVALMICDEDLVAVRVDVPIPTALRNQPITQLTSQSINQSISKGTERLHCLQKNRAVQVSTAVGEAL